MENYPPKRRIKEYSFNIWSKPAKEEKKIRIYKKNNSNKIKEDTN